MHLWSHMQYKLGMDIKIKGTRKLILKRNILLKCCIVVILHSLILLLLILIWIITCVRCSSLLSYSSLYIFHFHPYYIQFFVLMNALFSIVSNLVTIWSISKLRMSNRTKNLKVIVWNQGWLSSLLMSLIKRLRMALIF